MPVDTGRLKNSIGIRIMPVIRLRRVGTKVSYAAGRVRTGHMPPAGALDGWSATKGEHPNAVAERISIRGHEEAPYANQHRRNGYRDSHCAGATAGV